MEQLFNLSMWFEFWRKCSPAEMTRAWFREGRMVKDTHKKTD